jgi:hypothetical protein
MKKGTGNRSKVSESLVSVKTVDGSVLRGKINLGDGKRVSDIFTQSETSFIVLYEAVTQSSESKVLVINKNHIVWVEPEEHTGT